MSLGKYLLDNYIISPSTRYESHRLIYAPQGEEPIEMGGILAAALFCAFIIDTDEGDRRELALDTDEQREAWFKAYEREVRREDWGYLSAEISQLRDNYVQLAVDSITLHDICPNKRLLELAMELTVTYMQHLVLEIYRDHIWEVMPWEMPFPQWLIDAARVETRRQRFLHIDWTDAPTVDFLANNLSPGASSRRNGKSGLRREGLSPIEPPTFFFEGEKAADIMERYLQWLSDEYVAMKQEIPGAKITSADRKYIFSQETDWAFLADQIASLSQAEQSEWTRWQQEWTRFLSDRLLPKKEIRFWAEDVPEEVQNHLLYHLQLMEQHPAHFRDLTTAVYAMRQLGYIRRKCSDKDIRQWLSEHLKLNYTERNNASQFRRAMREHGRYTPEVRDEVMLLETMGFFRFQVPAEE